jgi:hypothetical protein
MSRKRYSSVARKVKRTRFLSRVEKLETRSLLSGSPIQLAPIGVLPLADGAEISAYDAASQRLFVTGESLHIVSMADPQDPAQVGTVDLGDTTSVAVSNGLVAAAVPAIPKTESTTPERSFTRKRVCRFGNLPRGREARPTARTSAAWSASQLTCQYYGPRLTAVSRLNVMLPESPPQPIAMAFSRRDDFGVRPTKQTERKTELTVWIGISFFSARATRREARWRNRY